MKQKLVFIRDINWCGHCPAYEHKHCLHYGIDLDTGLTSKPKRCKVIKQALVLKPED